MNNQIKRVTSINSNGIKTFEVGKNNVSEIKDNSIEFPDSLHIQFDAYNDSEQLIGTFINGALSVDYFNCDCKKHTYSVAESGYKVCDNCNQILPQI